MKRFYGFVCYEAVMWMPDWMLALPRNGIMGHIMAWAGWYANTEQS